jgi:hypothetical protein
MRELCTLIDFSRREPALPEGHFFHNVPEGYHWSATALDSYAAMAWIVYLESGTTCYEDKKKPGRPRLARPRPPEITPTPHSSKNVPLIPCRH